jgi:GntR family transcriptional regulator, transcriptional repressor for pyruvate dehydrogenase complex
MPIKSSSQSLIYESVLDFLKAQLVNGELKPGDRLPTVVALAEQLDVNPASVREAYRVLETLGILTLGRGKGTYVSTNGSGSTDLLMHLHSAERQSIVHLQEARRLVEPTVAALAAQRATPDEIEAIMEAAIELEQVNKQGTSYVEPDVRFHELVFQAAHNPVLGQFLTAIRERLVDSRRLTKDVPSAIEKAALYHKLIAIAIKERNAEAARSLMSQHIDDVEHSYMESGH